MKRGGWCCIRDGCISMSRSDEHGPLMDLGQQERPQVPAKARNLSPIVPRASISGRALVAVVAIMTFLASLTTGTVLLVSASAAEWQSDVASEITLQVRPATGRDLDRDVAAVVDAVRTQPGIVEVRPFTKDESAKLLEPWLGSGLSFDDLPVPRVIVARIQPGATLDLAALRSRVTQAAPSTSVDDHRAWIERMRSMTGATVFAGIGILALMIIATIISVSFATRGAMAANRPIVEVLHFVGAGDRYIANRFQRHFLRLGLEGGLIGGGAAMLAFGFSESIANWFSGTPVGDQFAALLGTFSLRPSGYLALAAQAVMIAAITAWASRRTLFATLDDID
jgi:cell division transport system permease protein